MNWYFFNKNIPQYQIDLIDDMFKYIYNNIGYKYIKEDNIINKFKTLKKILTKIILYHKEYYLNFIHFLLVLKMIIDIDSCLKKIFIH